LQNLFKTRLPQYFADATFDVKGVASSKSNDWLSERGFTNNGITAKLSNWKTYTRDADVVLISLGANDREGYGSPESNSRIDQLKAEIEPAQGTQTPIIIRATRPGGSFYSRRGDSRDRREQSTQGYQEPVVSFETNTGFWDRMHEHLTRAGAEAYVSSSSGGAVIVRTLTDSIAQRTPQTVDLVPIPPRPVLTPRTQNEDSLRNNVQNFFNNESNPIMKTFEENGAGGGIAVICKSLNVDWGDSTWRTDYGSAVLDSRAPWYVKIRMALTVIHDIIPGIGADGFASAPIYPVGNLVNQINQIEDLDRAKYEQRKQNILNVTDIVNTDLERRTAET